MTNLAHLTTTPRAPQVPARVPHKAGRPAGTGKYPFDKLEVGQSFFIPQNLIPKSGTPHLLQLARQWAHRRGLKFHPFSLETFPMGVRVTRVAVGDELGNRGARYGFSTLQVGDSKAFQLDLLPHRYALHEAFYCWRKYDPSRAHVRLSYQFLTNAVVITRIA